MSASFVIGFADDAALVAGVAWSLGGREGALVSVGGTASDLGTSASLADDGLSVTAAVGDREVSVEAAPRAEHRLDANPSPAGSPSAALGQAEVRITGPDESLSCPATHVTWESDPTEGAELVRHVTFPTAGGGAIVLIASRPVGQSDHAAESVTAWRLEPGESPSPFAEALLSTQYDGDGIPTRAGLELWPDDPDAPATRAAGSRLVSASADGVTAALMHTSAEGTAGIGGYLMVRP